MKRSYVASVAVGSLALGVLLGAAAAQAQKEAVHIDSSKAAFKEVVPGVSQLVLWGDRDKGPYAAFTKFAPGVNHALHTHTNDLRLVVLKGAYVYTPENGEEKRVAAGHYLFIPGGDRHVSGGDLTEGALFYEESLRSFDINFVR